NLKTAPLLAAIARLQITNPPSSLAALKFLDRDLVIGVDAHFAGDLHSFLGHLTGGELSVVAERLGSRLGIGAAAADSGDAAVGLDNVALTAEQKCLLGIAHQQQCFQVAQEFIGTPVLGQFHGGAADISVVLLQLGFKAAE